MAKYKVQGYLSIDCNSVADFQKKADKLTARMMTTYNTDEYTKGKRGLSALPPVMKIEIPAGNARIKITKK